MVLMLLWACTKDPDPADSGATTGDSSGPNNADSGGDDTGEPLDSDGDGTPDSEDCDPSDPEIHPGATEVCDGADNDCDDLIDEDLAVTLYPDADGDGYGDGAAGALVCPGEEGYVEDDTDCDDEDGEVNPGAEEVCDDEVDNDCDGVDAACPLLGELQPEQADAVLLGDAGEFVGASTDAAGDWNGDGHDDVLVGVYGKDGYTGAAVVVLGPQSGVKSLWDVDHAAVHGTDGNDYVGWAIAGGEDLDGDGDPDLALGAYGYGSGGDKGAAFVFYGPFTGDLTLADADATVDGGDYSNFAYNVSAVPDITGDGTSDVVIGSYGLSSDNFIGAAFVFEGPFYGNKDFDDEVVLYGYETTGLAGMSHSGIRDSNGDGIGDLTVSMPYTDGSKGTMHLVFGPVTSTGSLEDSDRQITGEAYGELGRVGRMGDGDVDGDGLGDVLAASWDHGGSAGAAYLVLGSSTETGETSVADGQAQFYGSEGGTYGARDVNLVGDLDGNGHDDVMVGALYTNDGNGAAYLWYGPVSGSHDFGDADATFLGPEADNGSGLGLALGAVGDGNGDGLDDLALGAWRENTNGTNSGAVYLWY